MTSMNRPEAPMLRWGVSLFWAGIALSCIKLALTLSHSVPSVSPAYTIGSFVAIYAIMALLLVYVAQNARWARIALFILYLVAVLPAVPLVIPHFAQIPAIASLTIAQAAVQAAGVFLIFRQSIPPGPG